MTSLRLHGQRRVVSDWCNKIFRRVATEPRRGENPFDMNSGAQEYKITTCA